MTRKRGNGEGSIYPHRREGVKVGYRGSYTVHTAGGPKRRYVTGKTREDVRKKLTKAMADRDTGLVVDDRNMTVKEYFEAWIQTCVRGTVRESTYSRDKYLVTNHVEPGLGRIKLRNLSALHLQGLYRDRLDNGKGGEGLSGSTVQKIHHVIHKALDQAVKWDLIPRNPADSVKAPTPTRKEMRPLSREEARRFLEAANDDRLQAFYVLAIHTGMRRGELLGLKWDDVDLDSTIPTLRVRRTQTRTENGRKLSLGDVKTKKSRRTIRLTPGSVESLRRHSARQATERLKLGSLYKELGLVFAGEIGNLINPSNLRQRSFTPLLEKAGLAGDGITFHDLRHTCASLLFQRNVHPKFVQELLGHASVAITLDAYSHMLPGMGGEAANAIDEALG